MKIPVTLFRVLNSQINYEKHIYTLMKSRKYGFTKPANQWNMSSQAAFIVGMEFALEIMKHRNKYDGLPEVDEPPKSDEFKHLASTHYTLQTEDCG